MHNLVFDKATLYRRSPKNVMSYNGNFLHLAKIIVKFDIMKVFM